MSALREPSVVEFTEVPSIDELFCAGRHAITWIHQPQTPEPRTKLLFPELANSEICEHHYFDQPNPMGIGLALLPKVLVSGRSLIGTSVDLYRLGPLVPTYVDSYLMKDHYWPVGDRSIENKAERRVEQPAVLLTHCNSGVYGHWLLEGLPKLLFLRRLRHRLPQFCIILPQTLGAHVASWIRFILPDAVIETYDDQSEFLSCRALLIPTMLSTGARYHFHPELLSLLQEMPRTRSTAHSTRLYVTRVRPSNYRKMSNQKEIETIAVDQGFQLVSPESMPISDQIALFARAELIVGEFGSAMHNALFSPSSAAVFCLNWINLCQSRIAELKRQRVGYLLPSNGEPVKYTDGAPNAEYHIDPATFRRYLAKFRTRTMFHRYGAKLRSAVASSDHWRPYR